MHNEPAFGVIRNQAGERLDYAVAGGAAPDNPAPLVVIGHGVTANKDRAWAQTLARALAEQGFANLRFSFAGNGDSEGDFRDSTVSKEVEDLGAVLDAVAGRPLIYVGHSMGAAVGVLRTVRDARIGALVSLGGMVDTADFARRKFGQQKPGDLMWDKPECPLSQAFFDDMAAVGTVLPQASQVQVPWLLVHGTLDTVVPPEESSAIQEAATLVSADLIMVEGADHLFSGEHEAAMAQIVAAWLGGLGSAG